MSALDGKLSTLRKALAATGGLAVAFSGGTDSSFLLAVAREVLGERVLAVTADSPTLPRRELERAVRVARSLGARHLVERTGELSNKKFTRNHPERCYVCKKLRLGELVKLAAREGFERVADGTNADDAGDFRPGAAAARELGILTPLADAGLTKTDIRELSRRLGLETADLPANACLATRLPYGEEITPERLARIEAAEEVLHSLGFRNPRVRSHGGVARLEVEPAEIPRLLSDELRSEVAAKIRSLGFSFVAVDLDGYRMGSMNEPLGKGAAR